MHLTRPVADCRKWERCRALDLFRRYGRISGQKSIYDLYAIGEIITTTNLVQGKICLEAPISRAHERQPAGASGRALVHPIPQGRQRRPAPLPSRL